LSRAGAKSPTHNTPARPQPHSFQLSPPSHPTPLLEIRELAVGFDTDRGLLRAVDGVSFDVPRGKTVGVVGESGCGKSVTAFSIMQLLPRPYGKVLSGRILFEGRDLARATPEEMRAVRAARIGMVFQEPLSALNPVHTIGRQLAEVFLEHKTKDKHEALRQAVEMLRLVGIPSPEVRVGEYPHQLSGGMRQRVMIAIALACRPPLIIADEPTTALDVTIQAQVLELMRELKARFNLALLLITHDFGVIAEMADRVAVMYKGRLVEQGPVRQILRAPEHEYTRALLAAVPGMKGGR
jgi:ABC-type dipeptide/oligopeptide/nickel transport system ATPase component